ncbi:nuclear transport factor 2 family protein [Dyella sp. 2HG41-7]|uniref:nuclear transport factor 2 family protein n=1 Tax=Dyella sp. 2HG41-7 TaxID=2883239 RepID=UPI001F27E61B|nr:nuclear transport factor 2 family protein [Dyella sp. 2HG41-7]
MNTNILLPSVFLALAAASAGAATSTTSNLQNPASSDSLSNTIQKLDAEFFDSFNNCSAPDQLKKHESYLNPNVEFYHDKSGVTWTRQAYMENTRAHVCGNFRRVLTAGSQEIYPIKDYGAIEEGRHTFCEIKSGKCFGEAKFLIIWHQLPNGWEITRIMSYAHEAIR